MGQNVHKSEKIISGILRAGSMLSIFLMALGLGLFLAQGGLPNRQGKSFTDMHTLMAGVVSLEPLAIMTLGVLVLLLTPLLRVVGSIVSFLIFERDPKYAMISLGVLVILAVSFLVTGYK